MRRILAPRTHARLVAATQRPIHESPATIRDDHDKRPRRDTYKFAVINGGGLALAKYSRLSGKPLAHVAAGTALALSPLAVFAQP
jgi:hypothetical protein